MWSGSPGIWIRLQTVSGDWNGVSKAKAVSRKIEPFQTRDPRATGAKHTAI